MCNKGIYISHFNMIKIWCTTITTSYQFQNLIKNHIRKTVFHIMTFLFNPNTLPYYYTYENIENISAEYLYHANKIHKWVDVNSVLNFSKVVDPEVNPKVHSFAYMQNDILIPTHPSVFNTGYLTYTSAYLQRTCFMLGTTVFCLYSVFHSEMWG